MDMLSAVMHLSGVRVEVDDFDIDNEEAYFNACDQAREALEKLIKENRLWDVLTLEMLEVD